MKSTTVDAQRDYSILARLYRLISDDLEKTEEILSQEMRSPYPYVDDLVKHGAQMGGKRLRPALLLLTAQACGQVQPAHHTLAAVIEMIHLATLVHDDVLDSADVRRHMATVNARWDNEASVLLGDYLFTHAFHLSTMLETTYGARTIGQATNLVCEAELRQKGSCNNFNLTEAEYFSIVEGKTAELCACACHLGAYYADSADIASELEQFGRELGIAFQIVDDILDFVGEEEETGKSLGNDLEQRKPTLPLIHLLSCFEGEAKTEWLDALRDLPSEQLQPKLRAAMDEQGSLEYSREVAADFIRRATARLDVLPASEAREVLAETAEFVLARCL